MGHARCVRRGTRPPAAGSLCDPTHTPTHTPTPHPTEPHKPHRAGVQHESEVDRTLAPHVKASLLSVRDWRGYKNPWMPEGGAAAVEGAASWDVSECLAKGRARAGRACRCRARAELMGGRRQGRQQARSCAHPDLQALASLLSCTLPPCLALPRGTLPRV